MLRPSISRSLKPLTSQLRPPIKILNTPRIYQPIAQSRFQSFIAGEHKSGHLESGPDKAIFYFDNVYPLKLSWLFFLPNSAQTLLPNLMEKDDAPPFLKRINPMAIIKDSKTFKQEEHNDIEIVPRVKEGGAFVKITIPDGSSAEQITESLKNYVRQSNIKPWWNPFQAMKVDIVRGRPWVEDLFRIPSPRLKIEFLPTSPELQPAELSQEKLFEYFRHYGKILEIVSQPFDNKTLPRYAYVDFANARRSTMAKNCLHGFVITESHGGGPSGTLLRINYEKKQKSNWFKDWIYNHPKIILPVIAALLASITLAVFDPIRTFFVKAHINHTWQISKNSYVGRLWHWLRRQTTDIFSFHRHLADSSMDVIWDDRRASINQIQNWLIESTETFIIVQGARGSGKKELVEKSVDKRKNLYIDCKPIQDAHGDSSTINSLAKQVGYRPVFSFINTLSGWADLAAQSTTGVQTGFSETLETQITKIFNNTSTALQEIALQDRKKNDADIDLSDDEYLEAHPEKRVIVVIDSFLHQSQEGTVVYDKLADWASSLTTSNIAHVIFLTHDASFSKSLSKALPDRVFRQINLRDSSPEAAKRFVLSKLNSNSNFLADSNGDEDSNKQSKRKEHTQDLDKSIDIIGGRLTDLEFLARRIKMGETPMKAVTEIIEQSSSEILKMYLFNTDESITGQRRWLPEQAWLLIEKLAKSESASLRYNEMLLDDTFKNNATAGPDSVLQALEQAELISIVVSPNGRPHTIKPGKPVYHAAFQKLIEDQVLKSRLDLAILSGLTKVENSALEKYESELKLLAELPKQPWELTARIKFLLSKISTSQMNIEKYEKESSKLKTILKTDF